MHGVWSKTVDDLRSGSTILYNLYAKNIEQIICLKLKVSIHVPDTCTVVASEYEPNIWIDIIQATKKIFSVFIVYSV